MTVKTTHETVDVVVAGGGTAGHIAALQAARAGATTSIIEAGTMLGGAMTAGGMDSPACFFTPSAQVVAGIPWELYTKAKEIEGLPLPDFRKRRSLETPGMPTPINIPIYVAVAEQEAVEAGIVLHYHEFVAGIRATGDEWEITSLGRGVRRITRCKEVIDCTGDADVVRLLGLGVQRSETRQAGTLEFKIENIDHRAITEQEVQALYEEAMESGVLQAGDFAYPNILPFRYLLDQGGHNSNYVPGADTSDADGQTRANLDGRARMLRMFKFLRSTIPGCERAELKFMYPYTLARETYRIEGETIVTESDFVHATDFPDKVCNAFNWVDLNSAEDGCDLRFPEPRDRVAKVPFRALVPRGSSRITVAGRNLSADRVALAGMRAQVICMAMGQAMGAAAALAVGRGVPSREIDSRDIVALTIEHGALEI